MLSWQSLRTNQLRRFLADQYSRTKASIEQREVTVISEYGRVGVQPLSGDSNFGSSADTLDISLIPGVDVSSDYEDTRVKVILTTGLWLPASTLLLLAGTISGIYIDNPAIVGGWSLAAFIVLASIVMTSGSLIQRTISEGVELAQYRERIHPIFFLFLASPVLSFISIASQLGWGRYLLSLLVFFGGSYIYAVQNASPSNKGERFRYKMASAWWVPEALTLSAILSLTRLQSDIISVPELRPAVLIFLLIFIMISTRVWLRLVAERARYVQNRTIEAISDKNTRYLLFLLQLGMSIVLGIMIVLLCYAGLDYTGVVNTDPLQFTETLHILEETLSIIPVGNSSTWLTLYVGLLFTPVITLLLIWGHRIITEWRFRRMLFSDAERISSESLGFDPKYAVYSADLNAPTALAVPVWHRATTVVVMDSMLVDTLDRKQLQAIYCHEEYHINHRHGWILDLLLITAPIAGAGTTMPYWFPRFAETYADEYAVDIVGHNAVASALRTVAELPEQRDGTDSSTDRRTIFERIFPDSLASDLKRTRVVLFGFVHSGTLNESVRYRLRSLAPSS